MKPTTKIKRSDLIEYLLDEMLKPYGSSFQQALKEDSNFYHKYKWTPQQEEDFHKFFIETLTTNTTPKFSKEKAEKEWQWFNFQYGLILDSNTI